MSTVAITSDRFETVAPAYVENGLEPIAIRCVTVEPARDRDLAEAREAAADADLILISSSRAVELLWPDGQMPDVEVATVGESTANAARRAGGRVAVTGGSGLLDLIESLDGRLRMARVVFPRAGGTDLAATARLREMAGAVEEHVVYRTAPVAALPTDVDAAAFASPSAVQGWLLTRGFDDVVVGVIGKTTAAAVARLRPPDVVAPRPAHRSLANALKEHLEAHR
jgi:uroporphyrinogen-III synthase